MSLKNELVGDISDEMDDLAAAVIQQINQYHVQGVGSEGSFTELTGWSMMSDSLADFEPPVNDGSIYIRLIYTDPVTGEQTITRPPQIDIDASTDTLTTIAERIDAIDGLSASVVSSKLHIQADTDYKFDFLPAVLSEPTSYSYLPDASKPDISVSGIYTGTINQTFTCRVIGSGDVGNGTLQLEVRNGDDEVVTTLNIGSGYAAGDNLNIGDGIKVSLGTGDLNDGDSFEIDVFADTDTSEVLSAAGINTFFSGNRASNMAVCSDITSTPGRVATALGADMTDNANVLRMAGLRDEAIGSLGDMTAGEFYRQLVTNVGQEISVKQMRQDNSEVIVQNLTNQQSELSGVDINDEAARMLVIQQMFQAMAKYMTTVQSSMLSIMDII